MYSHTAPAVSSDAFAMKVLVSVLKVTDVVASAIRSMAPSCSGSEVGVGSPARGVRCGTHAPVDRSTR